MRGAYLAAACLVALPGLSGCEKLMGHPKHSDAAAAPAPGAPAQVTPARPLLPDTEILAKVNGVPISKADLEFRIDELKAMMAAQGQEWKPLTKDQLQAILDEVINNELMSQDAVARGLDHTPDTQRRWVYTHRGFFAQEWLRWSRERLDVKPDDIQRFYDENKAGFREPETRRLRELVVATDDQARQALAQLHGGAAQFDALARQISTGPQAANGGLLPKRVMRAADKAIAYAAEQDAETAGVMSLDPALEAAAFAIDQVNGISSYVKGPDSRLHVFQLIERVPERQKPLTEVWDQIKNFRTVQKLQEAVTGLRGKAALQPFPDRLETVAQ